MAPEKAVFKITRLLNCWHLYGAGVCSEFFRHERHYATGENEIYQHLLDEPERVTIALASVAHFDSPSGRYKGHRMWTAIHVRSPQRKLGAFYLDQLV